MLYLLKFFNLSALKGNVSGSLPAKVPPLTRTGKNRILKRKKDRKSWRRNVDFPAFNGYYAENNEGLR